MFVNEESAKQRPLESQNWTVTENDVTPVLGVAIRK